MNTPFSLVHCIDGYFPQVKSALFNYPLLAVDVKDLDESLITWTSQRGYAYYCLLHDVEDILEYKLSDHPETLVFDKISHWPPTSS